MKSFSKTIVFFAFLAAIGFIAYHEVMLIKNEGEKYQLEQLSKASKISSDMKPILLAKYLASYACISMCLFDGSSELLRVKSKMDNPRNFTKVAGMSFVFYTIIVFAFSVLSYLAFG
jgi:hypothetical protein